MGKIYADDELSKIVFSDNETLKALQKKKISLQKKSVQLVDEKLYDINKKSEIMKNIKDNEFGQILEKLTELFNMYKLKRTTRVIETLEEFIEAMLIGITLYDRIFELTLEKGEESNLKKDYFNTFKENLIKFKKTASKIKKYEYKESFATASKINEFQLEIQKLRNEKEELSKKINDFASQHLSQIFKDWGEFNSILKDKGILKTVAELSATQEAFEKLDEFDTGETKQKLNEIFVESSKKLEVYLEDVKTFHLEGNFDEQNSIKKNLEELIENFSDDDDIIYILLHFQWANILINNNIMKYEQIDAEHSGTMNISDSLGSLKNAVLKHYFGEDDGENLSYNNGIKIQKKKDGNEAEKENPFKEFLSTHDDAIFYDLLLLEAGENNFKTFNELKSTKDSFFKNGDNNYYGPFNIIKGKGPMRFNFTCSVDDVIKIANAVQCMEVLKKSGGNKNLLSYINSSSEYREEGKMNFSLKENFLNQIEDQRDIFERTDEICSSLIENSDKISTVSAKEMSMFFEILNQFPDEKMKDNAGYLLSKEEFFLNCLAYFENSKKEGLNECLTYLIDKMEQIIKSFENKKSEFKDLQIEDKRITDFETFIKNLNLKDEDRPKGINMEEILKENQVRDIEVLEKAKKWQQNFIDFFNFSDINEKFAIRKEEAEKNRLKKKEKNEEAKKALTIDESFLEKTEKNKNLQANESALTESSEDNENASNEDNENALNEDNENALNEDNENALNEGSENALNEGSENALNEDSGNDSSEDSGNDSSEDSGNDSSEDNGNDSNEDNKNDSNEDNKNDSNEDNKNDSSEDSGNDSSEDSGNDSSEDSGNDSSEDSENASNEDSENASNEDSENASNEDSENASNEDSENASNEDSENASNEDSENASNEDNENALNEDNENASSEDNEIKTWENTLKASQKEIISSNENAVIKSESAELSEKEKKEIINSFNKLEKEKKEIVRQLLEKVAKIYNKKIFEILEKYFENISEPDKLKFQKIKTLRNFKTITSSSESNLILENKDKKITAEIKIEKEDFKKIAEINKAKKQSIYETIEKYISTIDSKL